MFLFIVPVIFTILCSRVTSESVLVNNSISDSILPEDGRLDFPDLARKYGRYCESQKIITEDGYILTLFHVPASSNPNNIPMLLLHGIADSSDTFIIRGETSLVFNLSGSGYVWAGNFRGNKYSRDHVTLNPDKDVNFWDFSITELSYYDCAAIIDYVLNRTGSAKVNIISHSLGNTDMFVLTSVRPQYDDKINVLISLAPIAYLQHLKGLNDILIKKVWPSFVTSLVIQGKEVIIDNNSTFIEFLTNFCSQKINYEVCVSSLFSVSGSDYEQLRPDFAPIVFCHFPRAISRKLGIHLVQIINQKRFAQYDYGPLQNIIKYGSLQSPEYDLSKVTTKVVMMVGENDYLSPPEDADLLNVSLPNVDYFKMPRKIFNHADFVWSKDMVTILYPYLHQFINKYI